MCYWLAATYLIDLSVLRNLVESGMSFAELAAVGLMKLSPDFFNVGVGPMELPLLELRLAGAPALFSLKLVLTVDVFGRRTVGPIELPLLELRLAGTGVRFLL